MSLTGRRFIDCPTEGCYVVMCDDPNCRWVPEGHCRAHTCYVPALRLDSRTRCPAEGRYEGGPIPCDLHEGHRGRHEWTHPFGQFRKEWR